MASKERVRTAIAGEKLDRVPVDFPRKVPKISRRRESRSVPKLGRHSCRPPVVVEMTAEPRFTDDLARPVVPLNLRLDQPVRQPLVVALAVGDHVALARQKTTDSVRGVPGDLLHPLSIRLLHDAHDIDAACCQLDGEEHVVADERAPQP